MLFADLRLDKQYGFRVISVWPCSLSGQSDRAPLMPLFFLSDVSRVIHTYHDSSVKIGTNCKVVLSNDYDIWSLK